MPIGHWRAPVGSIWPRGASHRVSLELRRLMRPLWGRGCLSEVKDSLGVGGPYGVPMPRPCPIRDCGSCCSLSSTVMPSWRLKSGGTRWGGLGSGGAPRGRERSGGNRGSRETRGCGRYLGVWKDPSAGGKPGVWKDPGAWGDPHILGETALWGNPRGWENPGMWGLRRCKGWGRNQEFGWTWAFGRDSHVWRQAG